MYVCVQKIKDHLKYELERRFNAHMYMFVDQYAHHNLNISKFVFKNHDGSI